VKVAILFAASVVTVGWLAACSKPASQASETADARQIRLAEPPPADSAVVSSLEAHQPLKPVLVQRGAVAALPVRVSARTRALELPAAPPHMMRMTTSAVAEVPAAADLSAAPEAKAIGFGGQIGHGLGAFQVPASEPENLSGGASRGGMILIRGGMGGVDDKCDLRGGHRGGIAINRMTPFGGSPRGGIR